MKALLLAVGLVAMAVRSFAATITASSASWSDVSNAVVSASTGDTVQVPEGSATWAGPLTISKAISLIGAGTNSTIISGANINLLFLNGITGAVRVSSIQLSNTPTATASSIRVRNARPFRIDRALLHYGLRQISVEAYSEGVIDHCTFRNGDISVGFTGDGWASWERPIVPGTTNTTVIEGNSFVYDLGQTNGQDHTIYHQDGGRSVTRFNTFDSSAMTHQSTAWFDSHGNWNTGLTVDPGTTNALQTRGQPLIEVYGNSFTAHNSYGAMGIRGGSMLFFSNTIVELTTTPYLRLTEEEGWQSAFYSPLRTNWPPHDGHTNTFIWANTINGSALTTVDRPYPSDTNLIAPNRDYWFQAPNSTNGIPAGAMENYVPLIYPHPLVTAQDGVVSFRATTARVGTIRSP